MICRVPTSEYHWQAPCRRLAFEADSAAASRRPGGGVGARLACLLLLVAAGSLTWSANKVQARTEPESPTASTPADIDEHAPVPVPEPTEKAMAFYRSGMWIWGFNRLWAIALPAALAFSGFSARLRTLAARVGRRWFPTIGVYIALFLVIVALIELPIDYYEGFVRLHAYGLSNQTNAKWLSDMATAVGVNVVVAVLTVWVPYLLLRRSPRWWWFHTALLSVPFLFVGMLVKPIWIDPLFNDFGPMKNQELERSILNLADRAGIESGRVFEVNKSVDTKAVNAYVTGFLGTKRIVLWDTLLNRLDEDEVLFVMAHEMGHYVLGHVVRSILLSFIVTLIGLYFVHLAGNWLVDRFRGRLGFDRLSDVASVPLLLMLLQISNLFLSPGAMAYSRYQEHEADRFALVLTQANRAGATAFVKLQTENLSNPRPGWVYKIFRASHPSIGERIDFCNEYRPTEPK